MKSYIFLAGILLPFLSFAQSKDSSARSTFITTSPRLGGVNVTNMVAPIKANGNSFTLQLPVADIGIPLYKNFSGKHPLLIKSGIRYQGLLLSNEQYIASDNFHSISVPLLVSYSLSRATNITLIGIATVASDFKSDINENDIQYTAGVRFGFRQNKAFKYGVTFMYINNYTGQYMIPVPDIDWTINNRLSFSAIVPARASLKYKISEMHSLGITAGYNGGVYRLGDAVNKQYLQLQQYSGGLIYDLSLGKRWKVNLIAGHTFMQRLETFNMDQKIAFGKLDELNDRIPNISYRQNSFVFQGGVSYRF